MEDVDDTTNGHSEDTRPEELSYKVPCAGVEYTISHTKEQLARIATIIPPKPAKDGLHDLEILADHQRGVVNVCLLILNKAWDTLQAHDANKPNQTEEEHHRVEPHHWPLDGYPSHFLPVVYVIEGAADYIATMYGRFYAGRGMEYMSPTSTLSAADVLNATYIQFILDWDLGTVTPMPNQIQGGTEDDKIDKTGQATE